MTTTSFDLPDISENARNVDNDNKVSDESKDLELALKLSMEPDNLMVEVECMVCSQMYPETWERAKDDYCICFECNKKLFG